MVVECGFVTAAEYRITSTEAFGSRPIYRTLLAGLSEIAIVIIFGIVQEMLNHDI